MSTLLSYFSIDTAIRIIRNFYYGDCSVPFSKIDPRTSFHPSMFFYKEFVVADETAIRMICKNLYVNFNNDTVRTIAFNAHSYRMMTGVYFPGSSLSKKKHKVGNSFFLLRPDIMLQCLFRNEVQWKSFLFFFRTIMRHQSLPGDRSRWIRFQSLKKIDKRNIFLDGDRRWRLIPMRDLNLNTYVVLGEIYYTINCFDVSNTLLVDRHRKNGIMSV